MSYTTSLPAANSHFISVATASSMTSRYRTNRETILATSYKGQDILPLSETFNRDDIDTLLSKTGCAGLRIYFGMDENLEIHSIIVAALKRFVFFAAKKKGAAKLFFQFFDGLLCFFVRNAEAFFAF